jgi:ankyrin repeat protein
MNNVAAELLTAFEIHSADRIRTVLDDGFDVRSKIDGKTPVNILIEMYFRSDRFPDCLRLLLERGAVLDDPKLAPVLLNDPEALAAAVHKDPGLLKHRTTMVCAFTPLSGASLLHVAAEYGHLQVARKLIELGTDVDARATSDSFGFGGQTPLFHTVNSNANRSEPVMRLLIEAGARADVFLPGITWGKGFEWETECFDVTPVSYAQLGLLRQFQRSEEDIYGNIRTLLQALSRELPPLKNIPNRYLHM